MRQTICDACGEPVTDQTVTGDTVMVRVGVSLGWYEPVEHIRFRDYHRACARGLTVAEVYASSGLVPL
jgi:hypothetical protein